MGYLHNESDTKASLDENHWLRHGGDIGYMDDDGFVVILGKKESFVTLKSQEVIYPLRVITTNNLINST